MKAEELKLPMPPLEICRTCDPSEWGFWDAFGSHYRSAVALAADPTLRPEGLLALLFSIECFLKHVLCTIRCWHLQKEPLPSGDFLPAKQLGHQVHALAR